ncbi:MAG: DNRLRE domain-containing protein [Bacteroidota bacterium]|nr:DNRLRE domain-containing protein [Bacteroidota bacterium]MDP4275211.1 DNRLRE domain-containing protein [Bacteroidota bacterium]
MKNKQHCPGLLILYVEFKLKNKVLNHLFLLSWILILVTRFALGNPVIRDHQIDSLRIITTKGAYISSCRPDFCNPVGKGDFFFLGKMREGNYPSCNDKFLIYWDLEQIPKHAQILKAVMRLYCLQMKGDVNGKLQYEKITENWESLVTYSTQPQSDTVEGLFSRWPRADRWFDVDITPFVKDWLNGKIENNGLIGSVSKGTKNATAIFASPNYSNSIFRPQLIIYYKK